MERTPGLQSMKWGCCLLAAALLTVSTAWAKPTTPGQAMAVVVNWLAWNATPMKSRLGGVITEVQTFNDDTGAPAYYVVHLSPAGLVFLPADDLVEPIIGFASGATSFDPSPANPLGDLVNRDIPARVRLVRQTPAKEPAGGAAPSAPEALTGAQQKWNWLLTGAASGAQKSYAGDISDVRVAPLLRSTWDQGGADGSYPPDCNAPCYNYFTPPYNPGDTNNYYSGCVATAMSQLMRFWKHPTAGVGSGAYTITYKIGKTIYTKSENLLGGNSPYPWNSMPLIPSATDVNDNLLITEVQRQAIGTLTHDAGISVLMEYTDSESSAYMEYSAWALVHTFKYSNAIAGSASGTSNINRATVAHMVNTNLDAGFPTTLGIFGAGGHNIVCDGYGYNAATFYNHVNMGWTGQDDAWYNLPYISTNEAPFPNGNWNSVNSAIYNVYPTGSGEIISGRVTNSGTPLYGVTITATGPGGPYTRTTDLNGIYALDRLPANSTFVIRAKMRGYKFTAQPVTTGASVSAVTAPPVGDGSDIKVALACGNQWAVNFDSSPPRVTLNKALDNNSLAFTTAGDSPWFGETVTSRSGRDAAQSGAIDPGQYSWMQTSVKGPGVLTFNRKVSSLEDKDKLEYLLDGAVQASWSGEEDWAKVTLKIPAGGHSVTWMFSRSLGSGAGSGSNCGWVDKAAYVRTRK